MAAVGTLRVSIEIAPLGESRFERLEALADTGATYTWIPRDTLKRLSVRPVDRRPFELADGRQVWYETGRIQIRIDGRSETTIVVFGDEGSEPILGAFTLEAFLLAVDPVRQRLIPVPGLLKKHLRAQVHADVLLDLWKGFVILLLGTLFVVAVMR